MNSMISKAIMSGLGFASLTTDAIQKTAQDLVKRSKLSEDEGKRLVKNLQRRTAVAERALKRNVTSAVDKALKQIDLERVHHRSRGSAKSGGKRHSTRTSHAKHGHSSKSH